MLKVLYAASNNENSKIQLFRFAEAMKDSPHQVKVAAYKRSMPNINIDWCLDCLMNIFHPDHVSLENETLQIYYEQVKNFAPDLIISDLEYFTSYVGGLLNIPVWQCSSSLLNFALTHEQKYNLGLFKKYYYLFYKVPMGHYRNVHIIDNAEHNFVYSHLCDTKDPPSLKNNFQWIRPYYVTGKRSLLCQHNIVAGMLHNNKKMFSMMKQHPDCVAFTEFQFEEYENLILKDIQNQEEYACNLHNSQFFACDGATSFLADAFYNGVFALVFPNINDTACVINSVYSENLGLSQTIYDTESELICGEVNVSKDLDVKFLHERVNEL